MKTKIVRTSITAALIAALAVPALPVHAESSANDREHIAVPVRDADPNRGPNPGGSLAGGCLRGGLEVLRMGPLGIPFTVGVLAVCLPVSALVGIAHEVAPATASDGTGAPAFAYPGDSRGPAVGGTYVSGRGSSGFDYPNSYVGCYGGRCGR